MGVVVRKTVGFEGVIETALVLPSVVTVSIVVDVVGAADR